LATDVMAAFEGDPSAEDTDEVIFSYPGLVAISIYRVAHELYVRQVPLLPRIMSEYAHNVTGVVIGETSVIGKRVKIYQGVTLGALSTRGGQKLRGIKRHPTIEDEVTIYSGASILGGETVIGRGVIISSNAFVTTSVPERTRVTVKNPELMYKDQKKSVELVQGFEHDWVI
jgi:serine O-acetyltransferase